MNLVNMQAVIASLLFAAIGMVVYAIGFIVVDKFTPYHLWREITEKQNSALAILVGAISIGIALIIAAAIHS